MAAEFQALATPRGEGLEYQISRLGVMPAAHRALALAAGRPVGADFPVWQVIGSPVGPVCSERGAREFAAAWLARWTGRDAGDVAAVLEFRMLGPAGTPVVAGAVAGSRTVIRGRRGRRFQLG
jgi:hypothetical protein